VYVLTCIGNRCVLPRVFWENVLEGRTENSLCFGSCATGFS